MPRNHLVYLFSQGIFAILFMRVLGVSKEFRLCRSAHSMYSAPIARFASTAKKGEAAPTYWGTYVCTDVFNTIRHHHIIEFQLFGCQFKPRGRQTSPSGNRRTGAPTTSATPPRTTFQQPCALLRTLVPGDITATSTTSARRPSTATFYPALRTKSARVPREFRRVPATTSSTSSAHSWVWMRPPRAQQRSTRRCAQHPRDFRTTSVITGTLMRSATFPATSTTSATSA